MYKFLVFGVVLVLNLGISTGYNDENGHRTYRSSGRKVSFEIAGVGRYEVHHENANWSEARDTCNNLGGSLTVIRSVFDEIMVKKVLEEDGVPFVWLGLREVIPGREARWDTGIAGDWVKEPELTTWLLKIRADKKILHGIDTDNSKKCGLLSLKDGVIPAPCKFVAPFLCEYKQI